MRLWQELKLYRKFNRTIRGLVSGILDKPHKSELSLPSWDPDADPSIEVATITRDNGFLLIQLKIDPLKLIR